MYRWICGASRHRFAHAFLRSPRGDAKQFARGVNAQAPTRVYPDEQIRRRCCSPIEIEVAKLWQRDGRCALHSCNPMGFFSCVEKEHRMMRFSRQFLPASFVLAGMLMAACAANAQADGQTAAPTNPPAAGAMRPYRGVERQVRKLTEVLSLTSDQQAQVKTILIAQRQQMMQLHQSAEAGASQQAAREQMKSLHEATDAKINALLNDEQKSKFAAWQQQMKEMREHNGGGEPEESQPNAQGS
jgi:periplasmic protein CpxP/Spy